VKRALLFLLALASAARSAPVETVLSAAGQAQPADQVGVGARALAMGSAFVGEAEGSSSLNWNAAGLSGIKAQDLGLHHNSGLADSMQESLIFGAPLGRAGGLAVGFNYINNGQLEGRDASGNLIGSFNVGSMGFQVGWGGEVSTGLSLGLAAKAVSQSLGDATYSSFAGDLSALWRPQANLRLGLNYANLGTSVGGSPKASGLRLGASLSLPSASNAVLLAVGGQIGPGGLSRMQVGAEDLISQTVAIRAGYQLGLGEMGFEGLSGVTFGGGVKIASVSLDYAYLPFGDLGSSQRVSLEYQFSVEKPDAPQETAAPAPAKPKEAGPKAKKPKLRKADTE
jgi:hypothetical protein